MPLPRLRAGKWRRSCRSLLPCVWRGSPPLADEARRRECAASENNVEAYFALWAQGCQEFYATFESVEKLLDDPQHYRRVLGWMFVSRADNKRYQMALVSRHLEERGEGLLAWITGNLVQSQELFQLGWTTARVTPGKAAPDPDLPQDYEEGLQKVFYRENLIVRMFAMADWFSPADIEPPTLETVKFFDRATGDNVPLECVPPILFSETMRDLDLVVSVAHVGGVDPEASHSTVEMRVAIAAELVRLLKLPNVSWVGSHAKIRGKLASYSVHMGSGVVHAEGVGMVAILPVHSQARGRIFPPFADDDPKTAEILSKIVLLSEDSRIKDPMILRQITG